METAHPGYLGSQDTFYVGALKGVGRIYQQSYVDPYSKVAQAKLYTTKTPITAADLLNDRVLPFHDEHDLPVLRIMTDRGTEYCGRVDKHDYQLFLAINDIDHTKTKVKSPQTNGIRELLSQDRAAGVLPGRVPQKTLRQRRCAAGRSGSMATSLQHGTHSSGQNVLRQNAGSRP